MLPKENTLSPTVWLGWSIELKKSKTKLLLIGTASNQGLQSLLPNVSDNGYCDGVNIQQWGEIRSYHCVHICYELTSKQ